jgi:hypothetical protein
MLEGKFKSERKPVSRVRLRLNELNDSKYIPNDCTFESIINAYLYKTRQKTIENLVVEVCQLSADSEIDELDEIDEWNSSNEKEDVSISYTPLDAFVKCNGLAVLAERLPIMVPFIHEPLLSINDKDQRYSSNETNSSLAKTSPDFVDYVIMNDTDEPFDDDMYIIGGKLPVLQFDSTTLLVTSFLDKSSDNE